MQSNQNELHKAPLKLNFNSPNSIEVEGKKIKIKKAFKLSILSPLALFFIIGFLMFGKDLNTDNFHDFIPIALIISIFQFVFLLSLVANKKIVIDLKTSNMKSFYPVLCALKITKEINYRIDEIKHLEMLEFEIIGSKGRRFFGYQLNAVGKDNILRENLLVKIGRKRSADMIDLKKDMLKDAEILSERLNLEVIEG